MPRSRQATPRTMAKFVNDRLVTTRSFAPGSDEPAGAREGTEAPGPAPAPEPAPSGDVDELLRREEKAQQTEAIGEAARELARRRVELIRRTDTLRERMTEDLAAVERVGRELSGVPGAIPDSVPLAELRQAKRTVDQAALELLKIETREPEAPAQQVLHEICSLSFLQLTRLGLGLGWPVAAALLAAGLVVAATLLALFRG